MLRSLRKAYYRDRHGHEIGGRDFGKHSKDVLQGEAPVNTEALHSKIPEILRLWYSEPIKLSGCQFLGWKSITAYGLFKKFQN